MDYFTHVVSKFWYRLYWGWMVACAVAIAIGTALALFAPSYHNFGKTYGLNSATLVLAVLFLAYACSLYFFL
ncbi:MAG TPA: hypothetical protein VMR45_01030, partial [Patescibacteria group bacterium]|nr:hypothetical protein [Patescibacteria group bacterium]